MRYPVLTLRRADLVAACACAPWLAIFDEVCRLRGDDAAPWVRRGGVSRRDPTRSPEADAAWREVQRWSDAAQMAARRMRGAR